MYTPDTDTFEHWKDCKKISDDISLLNTIESLKKDRYYAEFYREYVERELRSLIKIDKIYDQVEEKIGLVLIKFWAFVWCSFGYPDCPLMLELIPASSRNQGLECVASLCSDCLSKEIIYEFPGLITRYGGYAVFPTFYDTRKR